MFNKIKEFLIRKKKYKKMEKMFTPGTYESFLLHDFLLVANIGLTISMVIELVLLFIFDVPFEELHFFHTLDLIFGFIFMIESILRMTYVYIPNGIYFKPYMVINWIVIISLIWPQLFFNLAFLRLIRSFKVVKIYLYRKKKIEDDGGDDYDGIMKLIGIAFKNVFGFFWRKFSEFLR